MRHLDYQGILLELTALCDRALSGQLDAADALAQIRLLYGWLSEAFCQAQLTPIRQADLVDLSGELCRATLLALRLPKPEGNRLHLCDLARTYTTLEVHALFHPDRSPSAFPDFLAVYEEAIRDPQLEALFFSLLNLHLILAKIRLYL